MPSRSNSLKQIEAVVPGYEMTVAISLFAPAAVPKEIVSKLYAELVRIIRRPDMREKLLSMGIDPVGYSPERVAAMIKSETAKFGPVIKTANIKLD